jgi:hypothetical protein
VRMAPNPAEPTWVARSPAWKIHAPVQGEPGEVWVMQLDARIHTWRDLQIGVLLLMCSYREMAVVFATVRWGKCIGLVVRYKDV